MKETKNAFGPVFKLGSNGKLLTWKVFIAGNAAKTEFAVFAKHGEDGGKLTETVRHVTKGKNIGKKNETTVEEQARKEALADFAKKLKEGYTPNKAQALKNETTGAVQGGLEPMLALLYDDHKKKIKFPCYVQPKLDGIRCIATKINGRVTLWTRKRRPIKSLPHIEEALYRILFGVKEDCFLDGELYNHELKDQFSKIASAVRKDKPHANAKVIQFHAYDCGILGKKEDYTSRQAFLNSLPDYFEEFVLVKTEIATDEEEVQRLHDEWALEGYEGAMCRNRDGVYEFKKRSQHLQKVKAFKDDEYEIIGFELGEDGKTVVARCVDEKGDKFGATMTGSKAHNVATYYKNPKKWIGKMLTVRYIHLTDKEKVPRHSSGLRIREEE